MPDPNCEYLVHHSILREGDSIFSHGYSKLPDECSAQIIPTSPMGRTYSPGCNCDNHLICSTFLKNKELENKLEILIKK